MSPRAFARLRREQLYQARPAAVRTPSAEPVKALGVRDSLRGLQGTLGNQHLQRVLRSLAPAKRVARKGEGDCHCGGACALCGEAQKGPGSGPGKALGETDEDQLAQAKPDPHAGSATIQCDGKGGYEIALNGWAGATCGTKDCVIKHESSHMADWKAKWPDGCKSQPQGYLPKGDPPDKPLMTVDEYKAFLKASECTAHTVDLSCAEALPKEGECKKTVEDYVDLTKKQKKKWC